MQYQAFDVAVPPPVEARITRARLHVEELGTVLGTYSSLPPYKVSIRPGEDGRVIDHAQLYLSPPIEAAMIVSDAVHQARAALDNLVNALRPDGPAPGVYFPIRTKQREYDEVIANGALRGVPDWAREVIRAIQPFESSDLRRWAGEQLSNLHELARVDRHRVPPIHAAVVLPDYTSSDAISSPTPRIHPRGQWAEWEYDPARTGARVFRVEIQFGPEAGQPSAVDVTGWTGYLVERAVEAILMVLRSKPQE